MWMPVTCNLGQAHQPRTATCALRLQRCRYQLHRKGTHQQWHVFIISHTLFCALSLKTYIQNVIMVIGEVTAVVLLWAKGVKIDNLLANVTPVWCKLYEKVGSWQEWFQALWMVQLVLQRKDTYDFRKHYLEGWKPEHIKCGKFQLQMLHTSLILIVNLCIPWLL
jgi:hypothetical protein